jgi:hypothetical protein
MLHVDGEGEYKVDYAPGESPTSIFGGNSNWRGPVWMPINYLVIEALDRYHHFYGDTFSVQLKAGDNVRSLTLAQAADELRRRICRMFLPGPDGARPCHGLPGPGAQPSLRETLLAHDPNWRDLALFHEYFHGETGRGLGASHQTGWTALVAPMLKHLANARDRASGSHAPVKDK